MKSIGFYSVVLAAVSMMAVTGSAEAQGQPPALLNTLELRQLVQRGDPGDHARLSAHFSVLSDRYAAEAKRHMSMATTFMGNPNRSLSGTMSVHCNRLADLNSQSATTTRELAAYHSNAAQGTVANVPHDAARFEAGTGAPQPTERDLNALAARATTRADHLALEEYFLTLAKRYTAEADTHVMLAQTYRGTRIAQAAVHHDRLVTLARDSAKEANEAAAMHRQLAEVSR